MAEKRVLILSYSFSNQTRNLLKKIVAGLETENVEVHWEQLDPVEELRFPIGTIPSTVWMMLETFFRKRTPIKAVDPGLFQKWDVIILAGPTWSYHPSGPVLSFFDRDGEKLFSEQAVLPLISCRGYWRMHFWGLRSLLKKCGTKHVLSPIVFSHPVAEPWRTIGVFLKLAGKTPEASGGWFRKVYPKYGHSREQGETALLLGKKLGRDIVSGRDFAELHFETPIPTKTEL
ncbi:MAG: hypothetical protein U9R57_11230 [Thermodesulfobacteriota bacterium]|nr:hypothetical protein [Thermodesulfobacteriota bacterium]